MVEGDEEKSASEAAKPEEIGLGIKQLFRYGLQVVTHIGDTGKRSIKFVSTKLLKKDNSTVLQVDVENTGQRWLRLNLKSELYDKDGKSAGIFEGGKLRTYPQTSVRFQIEYKDVSPGQYKALVIADGGGNDVFGANYTLLIK